jgi:hypothetical protein
MKWINAQIEWIKSFLSEPINGTGVIDKASSKRLASIAVTFVFCYTYIKTSFQQQAMPDVPEMWVFLLLVVLGVTGAVDYMKSKQTPK